MKRIGLLGGMSWESTTEYYRLLNTGVRERRGGLNSADVLLRSVNFAELEELFVADRWDLVGERLSAEARLLERAQVSTSTPRRNSMLSTTSSSANCAWACALTMGAGSSRMRSPQE